MKTYKFKISGKDYNVDIKDASENIIKLEVNGSAYEVEMEAEVKPAPVAPAKPTSTAQPSSKVAPLSAGSSVKKVVSPLPGVILNILVKEGDNVKVGDTLFVLEAMKMENSVLAEASGTVQSIKVALQASVMQGDLLLEIA